MRKTIVLLASGALVIATWAIGGAKADATYCFNDRRGSTVCTPLPLAQVTGDMQH